MGMSTELYIAPRAELDEDELLYYRDIFSQLTDKEKVRISHQNLCVMYARTMVHINRLQEDLVDSGYTALGSQGQLTPHPNAKLLVTFQQQLVTINRALGMVSNEQNQSKSRDKEKEEAEKMAREAGRTGLLAVPSLRAS
jgi:phage terminase small subunit